MAFQCRNCTSVLWTALVEIKTMLSSVVSWRDLIISSARSFCSNGAEGLIVFCCFLTTSLSMSLWSFPCQYIQNFLINMYYATNKSNNQRNSAVEVARKCDNTYGQRTHLKTYSDRKTLWKCISYSLPCSTFQNCTSRARTEQVHSPHLRSVPLSAGCLFSVDSMKSWEVRQREIFDLRALACMQIARLPRAKKVCCNIMISE